MEPLAFAPKDQPLRSDVRRLGALVGELLRELAPPGIYATVEGARRAARRRRRGDEAAEGELARALAALAPERALEVVRAFSAYFGAVNMAEQVHRLRRQADYLRAGTPQPGSLAATAEELARRGTSAAEVRAALATVLVEPVFTAHPTEAVRRTLLKKDQRLGRLLVERFAAATMDPLALARLDEEVALELASAWQTDEEPPGPPTVADEVEHVGFFLSEVLIPVVPVVHAELARALAQAYGEPFALERPLVRFASWVGGDMDGNPNVGAETIRATLARHLELVLRAYRDELRGLHEHLSQSATRVAVDPQVSARVAQHAARFPADLERIPARYADMPYRRLLWVMEARLARTRGAEAGGYSSAEEYRADLALLADSLARHGGARAGLALVRQAQLRAATFGFHLAALDARQDARVHRSAVGELLGDPGFPRRAAPERARRLAEALASPPPLPREPGATLARTLEVFRALAEGRRRHGPEALGLFVVSMAQGPDDALAVLLLARAGGCVDERGAVPLDVAPLFETVDDLETGPATLAALCSDESYAAHLATRGGRQVVMLGYSDSNKDGGIAAARVALQRAQERLVAAAREHATRLVLFHGRGGSISRGGSQPRAGILAAPRESLAGHARATEQGEIVAAKFGLPGLAARTLEVTLGALLERTAGGDPARDASDEEQALAASVAGASRAAYRALVHDDPDFPALFRGMTPIDVIERMPLGSRPARRRADLAGDGIASLRAIPWVFAWTQCRATLPGWFGAGSGLAAAREAHGLATLRRAARAWPFLASFLADLEMVLAKSDLDIAARYAELAGAAGARLFPAIQAEHARCVALVLEVLEAPALLARDPTLARAIRLRNPYVDPLSFVQVDFLARWRAGGRTDAALERVLVQTVRGIARGLRNTG